MNQERLDNLLSTAERQLDEADAALVRANQAAKRAFWLMISAALLMAVSIFFFLINR